MRKLKIKTIGLLLVVILCLSLAPLPATAVEVEMTPSTGEANSEETPIEQDRPSSTMVAPESFKIVDKPLVQVTYHYYDDIENGTVSSFDDYLISSTHSYYALAKVKGTDIVITANKYPEVVPVSADALRFRVLINGEEDVTKKAEYDAATGVVSLPGDLNGQYITIEWYCPTTEVAEVPLKVTTCINENGTFTTTETELMLASNADTISVPLSDMDSLVVSQNGIDLDAEHYSMDNGYVNIAATPLGGDISITAYKFPSAAISTFSGGMSTMGTGFSIVNHTRSENQFFYGYYTSFYTANGNPSFCLDHTKSGLNAGGYSISRWLQRGTGDDTLIKLAYYLHGGPGHSIHKDNMFGADSDPDWNYALTHAAMAYVYLGRNMSAFDGCGTAVTNHMLTLINIVEGFGMPPVGFDAYIYNEGSSTNQPLLGWDYTPTGDLEIIKTSSDPDKTGNNSCYSLEGAVFDVFTSSDIKVGRITTDADGKGKLEGLDAGQQYYILEITPPKGFAASDDKIPFGIISGQTTTLEVKNKPQGDPVTILLKKQDADLNTNKSEGMASLAGAQFTIKYYKGNYSESELKSVVPSRTWIVETDEDGFAMLHPQFLVSGSDPLYFASNGTTPTIPLGCVTIQETKNPPGYLLNEEVFFRQVTASGNMEAVNTYNEPIVPDKVIRGGVSVQKWDFELDRAAQPQGDTDLAASLDIYNRSANSVVVGGKTYAPNTIVYTLKTNAATGTATTAANLLPYGDYEIVERPGNQPTGYLNKGKTSQEFSIRENGVIVNLKTDAGAIKNIPIRGSFYLEKWDNETNKNVASGAGKLDATVEIVNASKHIVLVDDEEYQPGEVVFTMTLSEEGRYQCQDRLLPYGTYRYRESAPPSQGYLSSGVLNGSFSIREDGEVVKLNTSSTALKNDPLRGDVKAIKVSDGNLKRLAGVPFSITSKTTGESHVVVTDRNGEFNTHSDWNPHSQNTNRGQTDSDGVWFGEAWTLDDDLGALLYDDYILQELPCDANEGMELITLEFSVYRHMQTIDLGTLTDDYIQTPEIFTTARDMETGTNDAFVSETTTIVDTIYYSGLPKLGVEYTSVGFLVDLDTGERVLVGSEEVTEEHTFKAYSENGNVSVKFEFDSTSLKGKSVVVYQQLYLDGKLIAEHCQLEENPEQTIRFLDPSLMTSASGEGAAKVILPHSKATIKDDVNVKNVVPDLSYDLVGTLMDRDTGEFIIIDGAEVTEEMVIKPKDASESFTMNFTVDASKLAGKTIVVFEKLYYNGQLIAEHCSLESEEQSVAVLAPSLQTEATSPDGAKDLIISPKTVVNDKIGFDNILPDLSYDLVGAAMDKETGEPITNNGVEVTEEMTFTPENSKGSVIMEFEFDSMSLAGKTIVVFEKLYYKGTLIAEHCSLDSEEQSVTFISPSLRTEATAGDGSKVVPISETAIVNDKAAYENVPAGETLLLQGVLVEQQSGQPLQKDGEDVAVEVEFVPDKTSGSVVASFSLDSRAVSGKTLVVFETLIHKDTGIVIAEHADLTDTAQMVGVDVPVPSEKPSPQPETPQEPQAGKGAKTGRDGLPIWFLLVAIGAGITAALLMIRKRRKQS
jgi:hypothetical protein